MKAIRTVIAAAMVAACASPAKAGTLDITPYYTCSITTTNPTICYAGPPGSTTRPKYFVGIANNSTSAQNANVLCYDVNNGSTSGTPTVSIAALGATQVITWPDPYQYGKPIFNGLVCQASAAVVGTSIDVYVR